MKYRAEIDGLRAMAVIPVIMFHAGFDIFSGGYVGVDVFFVISGYLITCILIEDIENKKFSIFEFYERRARRILPALTVVMLFSIIAAWMLLSDAALNKFGNSVLGVSLFASNIVFGREQGYFDDSAELNPLIHTWSLAVEEQYYLIFPIFLFCAWRFGKAKVFFIIILLAIISFVYCEWGRQNNASANFYLATTRAWELLAGSIAAFIVSKSQVRNNNLISILGLMAVILPVFFYDKSTPFPSIYTLIPVFGVVLLIIFSNQQTFVSKMLSIRPLVGVGLISYSAYLWHQPIFAYTRIATNKILLDYDLIILMLGVTFGVAFFSWKFIERPFRGNLYFLRYQIFLMSFSVLVLMILLGYASKKVVIGNEYELAKQLSERKFVYFENIDERKFIKGRLIYPLDKVDVLIVGSSRVMQINSAMLGHPILNLSVSGASIEDDIAIGLEALTKTHAKKLYISADPWLLNDFDVRHGYKSISDLYSYWHMKINSNELPVGYFSKDSLVDLSRSKYFYLKMFRNKVYFNHLSLIKDDKTEAYAKKAYDGFHIYNEGYLNNPRDLSVDFPKFMDYGMTNFKFSTDAEEKLKNLTRYLKSNGIDVTLVLSPYHPDLVSVMREKAPIFFEVENKFKSFAIENHVNIIGSYDSNALGCTKFDFFDGMHPKSTCMKKLFN